MILRSYIIAAIPRSGSNLLVRQLAEAGVGNPGEFFSPHVRSNKRLLGNLKSMDTKEYVCRVIKNYADESGILGVKFHWSEYKLNSKAVSTIVNKDTSFLVTRRRDLAMQAMSFETARSTGIWDPRWPVNSSTIQENADPKNLDRLESTAQMIVNSEICWHNEMRKRGITPFECVYEDYLKNPEELHRRINVFLGISANKIPDVEEAPAGKTGTMSWQQEILPQLRTRLEPLEALRPPFSIA